MEEAMALTRLLSRALLGMAMLCAASVEGQEYPGNRPVRILTSQAGSGSDIIARIVADKLPAGFGQRAIVDNRGILAPELAAKSPPDGYTVLFYSAPLWVSPLMRSTVPWDPVKDFAPVTLAVNAPNILVVHPSLPVTSVKELIALAKARPGELNYGSGSSGSTSHLGAELFNAMAGVNIVRIPYRGVGPALLGLLGGHVQVLFPGASSALPYIRSGKIRALAVASAKPTALVPGLQTIASLGLPGYEADTPLGVFLPAATSPKVIERLNQGIVGALNAPEVRKLVFAQGAEVVGSSPAELGATVKSEMARWGKLIKDKGIREE
jgi:tripartite-type tricarboxylate transporter receptor subunit TctC